MKSAEEWYKKAFMGATFPPPHKEKWCDLFAEIQQDALKSNSLRPLQEGEPSLNQQTDAEVLAVVITRLSDELEVQRTKVKVLDERLEQYRISQARVAKMLLLNKDSGDAISWAKGISFDDTRSPMIDVDLAQALNNSYDEGRKLTEKCEKLEAENAALREAQTWRTIDTATPKENE